MRRASPEATNESAFQQWLRRSTEGRSWWVRAPLVPALAWWTWQHSKDIWYSSIWDGINLAFHEVGHVLFQMITFGSEFWTIAGGTILELAIPVVAGVMLARQRDAFGVGVAVFWLGTALASVAAYVYDTRSQIFGRVSIGPYSGPDDWTYLLGRWGLIRQDKVIGMGMKEVAVWVMAAGVLWCAYVCWRMSPWGQPESGPGSPGDAGRGGGPGEGPGGRFDEAEKAVDKGRRP